MTKTKQYKMKNERTNSEMGVISVVYALVVLVFMFILAVALLNSFGSVLKGSGNRIIKSKTFYAAESALELAIWDLEHDGDGELNNLAIGGTTITTTVTGDSILEASASQNGISTDLQVYFNLDTTILDEVAIYCTEEVTNVNALDSNRVVDPDLLVENADSLPTIQYSDLVNLANAQGQVQTAANFKPSDGYPNGNFYYSPGVPNVTHVQGNLNVSGGRTIYGIYLVEGDATFMNGSARLVGVLYLPNADSRFNGGGDPSESSVTGGIVVNGHVDGNGNHITIQQQPEYMKIFSVFERSDGVFKLLRWTEL